MPRRKTMKAPSSKARQRRAAAPSSAGDQSLNPGDGEHSPTPIIKAQEIIEEARDKGEEEQNAAIIEAIEGIYTFPPKDAQREALRQLVFLRNDLILIAKTHFGKSLIWQAVSLLAECISNLGGKPCILNADTMTDKLLEEVKAGKYTHVLLSPALELHDKFRLMAIQPKFRERLSLVAVDDAHLVARWGRNFRVDPGRLVQLRILAGHDVPWLACSATLDQATLETSWLSVWAKYQRISVENFRPYFKEGEVRSAGETAHLNIPKTVVFFDTASEAYSALWKCRKWLELSDKHRYTPEQTKSFLRVFDQNTAQYDKELMIADFRRLASDSSVRVIFATEALEWVDLPDIRRVVQYGFPKEYLPAVPWRCGGRASRDGKDGEFIFLVDEWAFGSRDETAVQMYARLSEGKRLKHNTFAEFVAKEREPKEDSDDEDPEAKQRAIESFDQERLERLPKF
ncbi:ATP-dependent DNA helicase [Penicillium sp. DV-2018c]|nr:ATP-dependent DNA helicase [Penicillium sp. DV-2018c]